MHDWITTAPRYLFFTGKGGVGKTSLACATALTLADLGRRVLLISTDPASNLDEVLATPLSPTPRLIAGTTHLWALNIDPPAAAAAYRERMIGPYRGLLPAASLRSMEEQLSGACTTEIAAFDEFARFLGDPSATTAFDHVVFDTAPTGHTLRLLALPQAWTDFMATNTSGTSCLGPLAGLQTQQQVYAEALAALRDGQRTVVVLVSRAQTPALREAERTSQELADLGIHQQRILLNGVLPAPSTDDEVAQALADRGRQAIAAAHPFLSRWPVTTIPLRASNVLGLDALRQLWTPASAPVTTAATGAVPTSMPLPALIDELAAPGHGVILTMGKGGVGKTTLAAAIAMALARRGFPVTLSTTDPAAHVAAAAAGLPGITTQAIDPHIETEQYREQVLRTAGAGLDAAGRALLEEDLRSPCTEEIAIFRAFARTVAAGRDRFVVLDTAPTGHTLLLLDATEAYHREVQRIGEGLPDEVRELLPRLRDPGYTRVLLVTLPEATPVHEAGQLQTDLRRAGIEPYAWIVNQSLAISGTQEPLLQTRGRHEIRYLQEVVEQPSTRTVILPLLAREPAGAAGLEQFFAPSPSEVTHL